MSLALGCASPGKEVSLQEGDFALLELELRDCTSNDRHAGLEKALRHLYGTRPQIDLDRQIARIRVVSPVGFDFPELADRVRRSNTGLDGIIVTARIAEREGGVEIAGSGQRYALEGNPATLPREPVLRRFRILGWKEPSSMRVRLVD